MTVPGKDKFFFVHIMKTGGTSFSEIVQQNFALAERYPDACLIDTEDFGRRTESYLNAPSVVADVNRNSSTLRIVAGHVPYAVRELFTEQFITMTVLRHPVDRTLSYLKHCRQFHSEHAGMSLEEIYELPWFNAMFIGNYQTKIFSMTAEEAVDPTRMDIDDSPVPSLSTLKQGDGMTPEVIEFVKNNPARFILEVFSPSTGRIRMNEQRLRTAVDNLRDVEVVGVTEHYERFLKKLVDKYNWTVGEIPRANTGSKESISAELAHRIEQDCAADMALYESALALSDP